MGAGPPCPRRGNTIFETSIRTKRLELLRNYFHSCLRGDCLPNFNMFVDFLPALFEPARDYYQQIEFWAPPYGGPQRGPVF